MKSIAPAALAASALAAAASLLAAPSVAQPQAGAAPTPRPKQEFVWPETIRNARVLPAAIGADRLRQTMVGFSRALGVRCTHCHTGTEEQPLAERDFASDANPRKDVARAMIRMTQRLNSDVLPAIQGLSEPRVTCFTCHRGATEPATVPPPPQSPAAAPPPRPEPPALPEPARSRAEASGAALSDPSRLC